MNPNTATVDSFLAKKKAESAFLSLEDGETMNILRLREIKIITKAGFMGEEKEVLRLKCDVETTEGVKTKDFDNGTQRFAQQLTDAGITIGSSFSITRNGESTKTRYEITNVVNPQVSAQTTTAPTSQPEAAPVAEVVAEVVPEAVSEAVPVVPEQS